MGWNHKSRTSRFFRMIRLWSCLFGETKCMKCTVHEGRGTLPTCTVPFQRFVFSEIWFEIVSIYWPASTPVIPYIHSLDHDGKEGWTLQRTRDHRDQRCSCKWCTSHSRWSLSILLFQMSCGTIVGPSSSYYCCCILVYTLTNNRIDILHSQPYDLPDKATSWRCANCSTFNSITKGECEWCTVL